MAPLKAALAAVVLLTATPAQSIKVEQALFDIEASGFAIVSDLFGEDCYFADARQNGLARRRVISARASAGVVRGRHLRSGSA